MKISRTIFLFILFSAPAFCFSPGAVLKGKVYDENKNPFKNLTIRFSGIASIVTTNSGEFIIELPDGVLSAEIELSDNNLTLLYPVDRRITLPSDPSYISKIVVGKKKAGTESNAELAKKYLRLEDLMKDIGLSQEKLRSLIDEFIKKESKDDNINEENLKQAVYKEKRNERFSVISSVISNYIIQAQNLALSFRNAAKFKFSRNEALSELITSVANYNLAFEQLNNNKFSYPGDVSLYWDNRELSDSLYETILFATEDIHKPYILSLNNDIANINMLSDPSFNDGDPDKRKKEMIITIAAKLDSLDAGMITLETKTNYVLNTLRNNIQR
jgi:hypothetical protein